jgi:hypothetical protein
VRRAALAAVAAVLALASPAEAARLDVGFFDSVFSTGERAPWLQRAAESNAGIVRVDIAWAAPTRPVNPADPADPAYDFSAADASIKAATQAGLRVLASFTGAPEWAEGPGRPADAAIGSWKPDPAAVGDYGTALATRYSGRYPDPAQPGTMLPRVEAFQLWNEPNLSRYLSPQWQNGRTSAPARYRDMLNAFYDGLHAVPDPPLLVTAGTAPFGDPGTGGDRLPPARFVRDLLARQTRFDVLAHHPYSVGAPSRRALNPDDVSIPDLGKLTKLLRAAEHAKLAGGATRHRLWVTEVSYDSSPPDPDGIKESTHAGYLAQTFYLLAKAGADTIIWFQIRDEAPRPSYAATNQSGIYFRDGRPKLAQQAFRFPFYARRAERTKVAVWGRAPASGRVAVQRRTSSGWRTVKSLKVNAAQTFQTTVAGSGVTRVRARLEDVQTLAWRVR